MKVLLLEDVERLGYLGDVIEVKTGYARNYLLPQGMATIPDDGSLRAIADEKAKRAAQRKLADEQIGKACEAVEGAEAVIAAKANEQGHLFGSVDEKMIAANLREQGFEVHDDIVEMDGHIKEVGTHNVTLRFSDEFSAKISVVVVSEDAAKEVDAAEEPIDEKAVDSIETGEVETKEQ